MESETKTLVREWCKKREAKLSETEIETIVNVSPYVANKNQIHDKLFHVHDIESRINKETRLALGKVLKMPIERSLVIHTDYYIEELTETELRKVYSSDKITPERRVMVGKALGLPRVVIKLYNWCKNIGSEVDKDD